MLLICERVFETEITDGQEWQQMYDNAFDDKIIAVLFKCISKQIDSW